jgi:hypothetical protein
VAAPSERSTSLQYSTGHIGRVSTIVAYMYIICMWHNSVRGHCVDGVNGSY